MTAASSVHDNPFPGLRPFREDEEYLFFGRENQVDAMVDRLADIRFLAVVGGSGSGKSSLVNCGLRPALRRGLMARAGTSWRMAQFRPGTDPVGAMARALAADGVLFREPATTALSLAEIVETSLRMSKLGLIDIYEQAALEDGTNLLVVVDQFEELFRYRQVQASAAEGASRIGEEAAAFVNLLLEVKEHRDRPIFVVLTMRSDFLGDCTQFSGLAEAINEGQYLVPRMTRDERRAAIIGPAAVRGADLSPVLVTRLVNDVGDNPDQLSILQHALNRTWARWQADTAGTGVLDLAHYEAIGTMANALDQHAEEAFAELATAERQHVCERIFKALTDKVTDPRGIRRPTRLDTLCAVAEAHLDRVMEVMAVFRDPSRSFVMPPAGEPLAADSVIDISHESLMRVWRRLNGWADEERRSAEMYRRVAQTAVLHAAGHASLWRDPELGLALAWRERFRPNDTWASRYHPAFRTAMRFLEESTAASDAERAERDREAREELERQREKAARDRRDLKRIRIAAACFLVLTVAACLAALWAVRAQRAAQLWRNRVVERLYSQLASSDGGLVVFALDELSHSAPLESLFDRIPAANAKSNEWLASVSLALEPPEGSRLTEAQRGREWTRTVRAMIGDHVSRARKIGAPPSWVADDAANRRIEIPGGTFVMGSAQKDPRSPRAWRGEAHLDETPPHQVTLPRFWIQEHEVTNAEYRRFDPAHPHGGAADDLPVVNVTWHDAMAYAAWLGGSLPTEAQWEFAARGSSARTYPWGDAVPTCEHANFDRCAVGGDHQLRPVRAGRDLGRTPEGVYDLAGNVWEWTRDLAALYPAPDQPDDPDAPPGARRILRGGAFNSSDWDVRSARRGHAIPVFPSYNFGLRVVWSSKDGTE